MKMHVTVVGAGLAGSEASWQLAERGVAVRLCEMKPQKRTPAQSLDDFGELVCSNSLRGAALANAVGLLKEEMRRTGSLVMRVADQTRVPAGGALAVDREAFAREITRALRAHPNITIEPREVTAIPDERPVILATGPLTSDDLARDIERVVGRGHLAYYDAIAPIVSAESIDFDKVFRQSRYGKGGEAEGEGDDAYLNCPFDEAEYKAFVHALVTAEKVEPRAFEEIRYFEGCLPCEVMAERGERTLAFGPMKPVGLIDPRTQRRPYAVVQLRAEDGAMTAYNLVGFQTRMKYPEQQRVFRMIPGLENAEFLRLGSVHRNTFVDGPSVLDDRLQLKAAPGVYLAGQITGVEGYVESAASGLLCASFLADALHGLAPRRPAPTTALGALMTHVSRPPVTATYQPSNITWAHFPPLDAADATTAPQKRKKIPKAERYAMMAERALTDIAGFAPAP